MADSTIRVKCPNPDCGATLKIINFSAKRIRCPRCGTGFMPKDPTSTADTTASANKVEAFSLAPENEKTCPSCRAILPSDASRCPVCGAGPDDRPVPARPRKPKASGDDRTAKARRPEATDLIREAKERCDAADAERSEPLPLLQQITSDSNAFLKREVCHRHVGKECINPTCSN